MPRFNIAERLIDPNSPDRRPRRAAYALPTLFTAGNLLLGFLAIMESFLGSMDFALNVSGAARHFELAAIYIGISVFVDGLTLTAYASAKGVITGEPVVKKPSAVLATMPSFTIDATFLPMEDRMSTVK